MSLQRELYISSKPMDPGRVQVVLLQIVVQAAAGMGDRSKVGDIFASRLCGGTTLERKRAGEAVFA